MRLSILPLLLLISAAFAPGHSAAQGFAGLGNSAEGFAVPRPGQALTFPQDHGAHPDFRIEWWYLTANLRSADGAEFGLQWTLFRTARHPADAAAAGPWDSAQIWMGHAALTTQNAHYFAERFARGGIGQAGARPDPFGAWIDEWHLSGPLGAGTLAASGHDFAYRLDFAQCAPMVLHGDQGYSVKSAEGQASYYYSLPCLQMNGTLSHPGGDVEVSGNGWLDREWSSQPLSPGQIGWDWFSLSFETGAAMMGFVLRSDADAPYSSATWIAADGQVSTFGGGAFSATPLARQSRSAPDAPTTWRLRLPARGLDIEVEALNPEAWMGTRIPYWEGPVRARGSHRGRGYLEMTGYSGPPSAR